MKGILKFGLNRAASLKIMDHVKYAQKKTAFYSDIAKRAGSGKYKNLSNVKRKAGKQAVIYNEAINKNVKRMTLLSDVDRIVNARGKGIKFIRKGGRIIPIRAKADK